MSYELIVESVEYKTDDDGKRIKVTVGRTISGTKVIMEEPEHTEEELQKIFENMLLRSGLEILGYDPKSVKRYIVT